MDILNILTNEFKLNPKNVKNTIELIDADNTIPFIARYRKELTGSLDDQILREMYERLLYLRKLEKRIEEIISNISQQGKLTTELENLINNSKTLAEVEDLYRPFKQKRKTRASIARDAGLEKLAEIILNQDDNINPAEIAKEFLNDTILTTEQALNGSMDIIAEDISDSAYIRKSLRSLFYRKGELRTKADDTDSESVYKMYYDYKEPVNKIVPHRILAINRGESDDILKVSLIVPENEAIDIIKLKYLKTTNMSSKYVLMSCEDSYSRLIFPSLEREIRTMLTERASESAVKVFATNLRQLLMQPPVRGSVALGLDPAYRTGCKIAVVDNTGKVLDTTVIYPTPPQNKIEDAKKTIKELIYKYEVTIIAIGNGTASRESEAFISSLIKEIDRKVSYMVVSEAGASVYSASKLAAEEFPQFDVSLRSAISIARRMQDPLSELVKIEPKAIGVGQYQHDIQKTILDNTLDGVVESCVNQVGVDLNTASHSLLQKVSGINISVAKNIVLYREQNGQFKTRKELLNVSKLGAKAFTQSAGFLRVSGGENFLDNTGVHPESYQLTKSILKFCGFNKKTFDISDLSDIQEQIRKIGLENICDKLEIGLPTLMDIINEISKPGRDPRDELPKPMLRDDILEIKDLKIGMELKGTVRNVIDFGAFVDIGVHDDGLVHISQICDKYIKHPLEVLNVGDIVTVFVLDIDEKRKRIALTMKKPLIS